MSEPWKDQCPECGEEMDCVDNHEDYQIECSCSRCGYEEYDDYIDLFGPMSVPYGGV